MTLLVRNEADILRDNLEFHRSVGIDHFIITDNGSEDATLAIAESYVERGLADLWIEPEDTYDQGHWVTRMARYAHTRHNADWVINNDADEFWSPKGESLPQVLEAVSLAYDAIHVDRHNFPPVREGGDDYLRAMLYREAHSFNALGAPLPGKLMHRGCEDVSVAMGNHDASVDSEPMRRCNTSQITIHHFPVRSYAQFEKKIAKGGEALQRNPTLPQHLGATWRRLYDAWLAGGLPDWYAEQELTSEAIGSRLRDGSLTISTELRDLLRSIG